MHYYHYQEEPHPSHMGPRPTSLHPSYPKHGNHRPRSRCPYTRSCPQRHALRLRCTKTLQWRSLDFYTPRSLGTSNSPRIIRISTGEHRNSQPKGSHHTGATTTISGASSHQASLVQYPQRHGHIQRSPDTLAMRNAAFTEDHKRSKGAKLKLEVEHPTCIARGSGRQPTAGPNTE